MTSIADEIGLMMRFPLSITEKLPLPEGNGLRTDVGNVVAVFIRPT